VARAKRPFAAVHGLTQAEAKAVLSHLDLLEAGDDIGTLLKLLGHKVLKQGRPGRSQSWMFFIMNRWCQNPVSSA
jgi:hypothetical protein